MLLDSTRVIYQKITDLFVTDDLVNLNNNSKLIEDSFSLIY
jgi:hypothetical protein